MPTDSDRIMTGNEPRSSETAAAGSLVDRRRELVDLLLDTPLEVVAVLRECSECHERKPLEHFLLFSRGGSEHPVGDVKVCAACRGHKHDYIRKTPTPTPTHAIGSSGAWPVRRMCGRYLDLPLDDWAERQSA